MAERLVRRAVDAFMARDLDGILAVADPQIELRSLNPERRAQLIARRDAYEAGWRRAIADGIASGDLRPFDVRLAGIGILSACHWFTQWYRPDGELSVDQIADAFLELYLGGLQPREPD